LNNLRITILCSVTERRLTILALSAWTNLRYWITELQQSLYGPSPASPTQRHLASLVLSLSLCKQCGPCISVQRNVRRPSSLQAVGFGTNGVATCYCLKYEYSRSQTSFSPNGTYRVANCR